MVELCKPGIEGEARRERSKRRDQRSSAWSGVGWGVQGKWKRSVSALTRFRGDTSTKRATQKSQEKVRRGDRLRQRLGEFKAPSMCENDHPTLSTTKNGAGVAVVVGLEKRTGWEEGGMNL